MTRRHTPLLKTLVYTHLDSGSDTITLNQHTPILTFTPSLTQLGDGVSDLWFVINIQNMNDDLKMMKCFHLI